MSNFGKEGHLMYDALTHIGTLEQEANHHYYQQEYSQAIEVYKQIIPYAKAQKDFVCVMRIVTQIISCYLQLENYKMAFKQVEKYDYLFDHNVNAAQKKEYILYKGLIHMKIGDYERSETFFQQTLQLALEEENTEEIILYGTYYLGLLQRSQKVDKGLSMASLIDIYMEKDVVVEPRQHIEFLLYYVALLQQTVHYERSANYLLKVEELSALHGFFDLEAVYRFYRAKFTFLEGHTATAYELFETALTSVEQVSDYEDSLLFLKECIVLFEQQNLYKELASLQKRYITLLENPQQRTKKAQLKRSVEAFNFSEVEKIAHRDSLTGVYNRYYLEKEAENIVVTSMVMGENCSCAVFDIDYFKTINDSYGHLTGDKAIQELARRIEQEVANDPVLFARYGGDEFVLLLSMPYTQAEDFVISLYEVINQYTYQINNIQMEVTVSMGLVHNEHIQANTFKELFQHADKALYLAKENGRNQLYIHA